MEWGIPTLIEAPSPEESAALCSEMGFDFVELSMDLPDYQSFDIPRLRRVAEKYGIYYTIHLEGLMDLCCFNPRVADAYLQTLMDTIQAAKQLGVPNLNMHFSRGNYFTLPEQKVYLYERYNDHFRARIANAIVKCESVAKDTDLKICIENTSGFTLDYLRKGLEMYLQSSLFCLTYAIEAVFPETEVQNCIIHQIRNSTRYVSYKDLKALMADLKAVYAAVDEIAALDALEVFAEHWDKKYPKIASSWRDNWAQFEYLLQVPTGGTPVDLYHQRY